MNLSSHNRLDVTCIHEAGHAVVARALGLTVTEVSTIREGRAAGFAEVDFTNTAEVSREVLKGVVASAGREAECVILSLDRGDGQDNAALAAIVNRLLATMRSRANALVREHSATIAAVAFALRARGRLSGAELDALIAEPAYV